MWIDMNNLYLFNSYSSGWLRKCIVYKFVQSYGNNQKISFPKWNFFFSAKLEKLDLLISKNWLMDMF